MKETIIKGTGDSRFLKTSLPAGTSWDAALAMLRAGTFPVDLAGINMAGIQQLGDALNKANLLQDTTAGALGIPTTAVPDDALMALYIGGGKYGFQITLLYPTGAPIPNRTIQGLVNIIGGPAVTDANGKVLGIATTPTPSITVDFSEYFDIVTLNTTLTSTAKITPITLTATQLPVNTPTAITTSMTNKSFSPLVKDFDLFLSGGGGAGANDAGGGGGAGNVTTVNGIVNNGETYNIVIGAGGIVNGSLTYDGGTTTFGAYSAAGGAKGGASGGASNNGSGGNGGRTYTASPGGNSVYKPFGLNGYPVGGGGGGGNYNAGTAQAGGTPYGGIGGGKANSSGGAVNSTPGSGYGGGGGGGGGSRDYGGTAASGGYQGVVYLRWRNKP